MPNYTFKFPALTVTAHDVETDSVLEILHTIQAYLSTHEIPDVDEFKRYVDDKLRDIQIDAYSGTNPPPYPVKSVNGQTGNVVIDIPQPITDAYRPSNPPPYPVTSVNGQTGDVTVQTPDPETYTPDNPPPYPVTSVNGQTGAVTIETGTPNAYTPDNPPPYPVTSVNGKTGAVTIETGDKEVSTPWYSGQGISQGTSASSAIDYCYTVEYSYNKPAYEVTAMWSYQGAERYLHAIANPLDGRVIILQGADWCANGQSGNNSFNYGEGKILLCATSSPQKLGICLCGYYDYKITAIFKNCQVSDARGSYCAPSANNRFIYKS